MNLDDVETIDDGARQFVLWALAMLGVSASTSDRDESRYDIPKIHQAFFRGAKVAQLVYGGVSTSLEDPSQVLADGAEQLPSDDAALIPVDEPFLAWLMDQLRCVANVPYGVPTFPAVRVHEISARLFEAYTVDGGTLHLSGCTLEERPVLRQTWLDSSSEHPPRLVHRFTDTEGALVPNSDVEALGLSSIQPPAGSLPPLSQEDVRAWCAAATRTPATNGDMMPSEAAVVASVVWCPFAAGKVEFVIGDTSAEVPFSGWARKLATGLVEPPAFECPVTGIQSYMIATTDDGRITAREAIQVCAISGRRVLISELKKCELTGQVVLPEYLQTCPVSGQTILDSAFTECGTCQQMVSPACLEHGICGACRTMIPICKDDPRMARVFGEYPRLDRWRNWRIGETSTSYILVAAAFIKRVLVVVNKESLELVRLATRNRFSSQWAEPPLTERQELLR